MVASEIDKYTCSAVYVFIFKIILQINTDNCCKNLSLHDIHSSLCTLWMENCQLCSLIPILKFQNEVSEHLGVPVICICRVPGCSQHHWEFCTVCLGCPESAVWPGVERPPSQTAVSGAGDPGHWIFCHHPSGGCGPQGQLYDIPPHQSYQQRLLTKVPDLF